MTAVIYARYSSDNQREESIEGQIRECTAYAEKNGITIVKHYIDRAISAKTDNRPEFQQMIKDSDKKLFDIVLVWKLDRFARNRYDSARYKTQLKKNGVKLMSATEIISEGPEGIILESVLEGYAEYYSADLSEKVVRGMTENALKGIYNGGTIPFGYMIDETRHYQPDPLLAPYVEQTFQKYADGATMTDLRDWLKAHNIKNSMGGEMSYNTIQRMLSNRRYIGELRLRDVVQPNAIPALVSEDLFNKVQEKLAKNKKAPARHKAEESYLLTTKLYCGKCGALMFGESGVSHTGKMYTYYKCAAAKKKKTCDKKAVRKQWLEDLVVNETMKLVEDDASMNAIIAKVMELQNQESTDLPIYEKQLKETEVGITNMLNAIQMGILTSSTKERLEALEEQRKELQARIAEERLAKPKMKEEFVRFWLLRFRKLDMTQPEQRQALVDTFINAIYLYDDKVLITFNYKEGTETVAFGEAVKAEKSSDMSARGAPNFERQIVRFGVLFCYVTPKIRGLHGQCTVFARSAFSWESSAWAGIALKCVVNFASGQQSQTELGLYFGVCILQKLQQSGHRDGRFACSGYSLRAGAFGLSIEAFLKLLAQFHAGGLLDMGVGVHQHICRSVSCGALNGLHIAAGNHQLIVPPESAAGSPPGEENSCISFHCSFRFRFGFGLFRRQYRLGCRQHFLRRCRFRFRGCRFICREKLLPYFFEPWGNGALFFRLHHLHGGRSDRCFIGSRYFRRCGDDFCRFFRCCLLRGGFLCRGNRRLCQCQLDRVQDAGGGVGRAGNGIHVGTLPFQNGGDDLFCLREIFLLILGAQKSDIGDLILCHRDLHRDLALKTHSFGSVDAVQIGRGRGKFLHHQRCGGLRLRRQGVVDYLAGQSVLHRAQNAPAGVGGLGNGIHFPALGFHHGGQKPLGAPQKLLGLVGSVQYLDLRDAAVFHGDLHPDGTAVAPGRADINAVGIGQFGQYFFLRFGGSGCHRLLHHRCQSFRHSSQHRHGAG